MTCRMKRAFFHAKEIVPASISRTKSPLQARGKPQVCVTAPLPLAAGQVGNFIVGTINGPEPLRSKTSGTISSP